METMFVLMVFSFMPFLLFPTPAPGLKPLFEIWKFVTSVSYEFAHKVSKIIIASVLIMLWTLLIMSALSMPVRPNTLVEIALTSHFASIKFLVAIMCFKHSVPKLSALMCLLPSPTTSTFL